MMASNFAKKLIQKHEGIRLRSYHDSLGFVSIGIGRRLDVRGITKDEALFLFENDLIDAEIAIGDIFGIEIFRESQGRIAALLDMAFNLGEGGLKRFSKMIAAVKNRDWETAADEVKYSAWFIQAGLRGQEIVDLLRRGE